MNQTADRRERCAVVCLFCGLHTPAPENRSPDDPRVSIVRCRRCGKEAPYPASSIIDTQASSETPKFRVAGLN